MLATARRDFPPDSFDPNADLLGYMQELTVLTLVGIVDPPRPTAKDAIATAKQAGIRVRMITGDHAVTAAAIASQLGIEGRAITGADFDAMSDEEAARADRRDRRARPGDSGEQGAARRDAARRRARSSR